MHARRGKGEQEKHTEGDTTTMQYSIRNGLLEAIGEKSMPSRICLRLRC